MIYLYNSSSSLPTLALQWDFHRSLYMQTFTFFFTIHRLTHGIPSPFPAPFVDPKVHPRPFFVHRAVCNCLVTVLSTSAAYQFLPGWFPVQKLGSVNNVCERNQRYRASYLKNGKYAYTHEWSLVGIPSKHIVQDVSLGSCQAMGRRWGDQGQSPQVGTCH